MNKAGIQSLRVLVGVDDADRVRELEQPRSDTDRCSLQPLGMNEIRHSPEVDAFLLLSAWAHERYGGVPKPGLAQVISTRGEPGSPEWVVTTAPRPARLGARGQVMPIGGPIGPRECYAKVFGAIWRFNTGGDRVRIKQLGIHFGFLGIAKSGFRTELDGLVAALLGEEPHIA